jgi:DHA2 family multidrug resistance protein
MLYFASFNLSTNYAHEAVARAIQGFGIAFLFVPVSQLAYSYLPKNKNNKASSLTNLFRNQGGSVGIAFVTTMLARRTQYHHTVLAAHISDYDRALGPTLSGMSANLVQNGYSAAEAAIRAPAQVYGILRQQAAMLGFLDCFYLLALAAFCGPVLALGIRKFGHAGDKSGGAH